MTTNSKHPTDTFVLVPGVHIQVNSKSGNTYYITQVGDGSNEPRCTCKGFSYYGKCRHIEEASHVHVEFFTVQAVSKQPSYSAIREHNLDIISGKAPAIKPTRRIQQ